MRGLYDGVQWIINNSGGILWNGNSLGKSIADRISWETHWNSVTKGFEKHNKIEQDNVKR